MSKTTGRVNAPAPYRIVLKTYGKRKRDRFPVL